MLQATARGRRHPQFVMAVSFPRASVFDGLPVELQADVQSYMDTRLSESSRRTVNAALGHWRPVCRRFGWPDLILSDDPSRGGKMASFVLGMAGDIMDFEHDVTKLALMGDMAGVGFRASE